MFGSDADIFFLENLVFFAVCWLVQRIKNKLPRTSAVIIGFLNGNDWLSKKNKPIKNGVLDSDMNRQSSIGTTGTGHTGRYLKDADQYTLPQVVLNLFLM